MLYILSKGQPVHSNRAAVIAHSYEEKDLKTSCLCSPEARRFLHTSQICSPFDVGVLTHVLPPPNGFTWTLRLQLHPHPLLTADPRRRFCHGRVSAGFCLLCSIAACSTEGSEEGSCACQLGWTAGYLPVPTLSPPLISSPVMIRGGGVIVVFRVSPPRRTR